MKLKFVHYFFKDKDGYHKDEDLKQRWESYLYVMNKLAEQSLPLLKEKLIYFAKFKKWSSFKRLIIILCIGGLLYEGGSIGVKATKNYLNNRFGWFDNSTKEITLQYVYVPDTIVMKDYIKTFSAKIGMNESQIIRNFDFVTYYTIDSTKTLKKFLQILGQIESGNDYKKRRVGSQYLGRWAMGDAARRAAGFGTVTYEKFLNTPQIQDAAVVSYIIENYKVLKPYLRRYDNKIIRGYHLTISGMLAMAHNCGPDGVMKFLDSNCKNVPSDANGTSDRFLILGNYDLSSLKPSEKEK